MYYTKSTDKFIWGNNPNVSEIIFLG